MTPTALSNLNSAIAAHLAHGAASGFDPLTDSLADQLAVTTTRTGDVERIEVGLQPPTPAPRAVARMRALLRALGL